MLGTFTPLGERGRQGRFRWTALLYVVTSAVSGAVLGAVLATLGAWLALLPVALLTPLAAAITVAAAMIAVDLFGKSHALPHLKRQVDDGWVGRLRPSIYAAGFGGQLGVAFTTHVVAATTYAAFACAALTQRPVLGAAVGGTFGLVRGLLVYLARKANTPARLARTHRRVLAHERRARFGLRLFEIAALAAAAAALFGS